MKVITVLSGKGGVGKTTTVSNLSAALTDLDRDVVAIDGNITTPDLGYHFGVYRATYTLSDVLKEKISLDEAICTCSNGVGIILGSTTPYVEDVDLTALKNSLEELGKEMIILDSPPGLGREIIPNLSISDEALVVVNPEIPSVADALKAVEMCMMNNVQVRGVVLNRVRKDKYELPLKEVEGLFSVPIVAVMPEDSKVRESIALGNPVVLNSPYSRVATEFNKLACFLIGEEYKPSGLVKRLEWSFRNLFRRKGRPLGIDETILGKTAGEEAAIEEAEPSGLVKRLEWSFRNLFRRKGRPLGIDETILGKTAGEEATTEEAEPKEVEHEEDLIRLEVIPLGEAKPEEAAEEERPMEVPGEIVVEEGKPGVKVPPSIFILKTSLKVLEVTQKKLGERFEKGLISEEIYTKIKHKYDEEIKSCQRDIEELEAGGVSKS